MLYMYNSVEIEAIKLAVRNLKVGEYSCKDILLKSIMYLKENYVINMEKEYLKKAIWHMYAYLEMGFSFDEGREIFQSLLELEQLKLSDLFPKTQWNCERVILNKTNVRNLLGKWNPGLHSMKITEVVNDIIYKASKKIGGEYLYYCGKPIEISEDEKLWEHTFKLYVEKEVIFFHDINRNRYYILEEKE